MPRLTVAKMAGMDQAANLAVVAADFVRSHGRGAFAWLNEQAEIAKTTGDRESAITWWDIALFVAEITDVHSSVAGAKRRSANARFQDAIATYRIEFVDHGDNVYGTEHVEHDDEEALIKELRVRNTHGIGYGYDVWDGERLVHRHRK